MDTNSTKAWVLMGSTVAGAVGGGMAAPRLGAALGVAAGPWGVVVGALMGALVGASFVSVIIGDVEFPARDDGSKRRRLSASVSPAR